MNPKPIDCAYLPLVDSAPLIIAQDLSFAAEEGLHLNLHPQPSWSALRDRLAFGHVDFAHILSPMPVAMSLGLGGVKARIDALMVLSVNGTVLGVTADLEAKMRTSGWQNTFQDPASTAHAALNAAGKPIRIGVPFPFSMHRMLLDYWITQTPNFDPAKIEIVTVPPPKMADAVREGHLDMFCVGEPWGSVAVQNSNAKLILPGSSIWAAAPEKVLGVRHDWAEANPQTCHAMMRAVYKACKWLDQPANKPLAIEILTRSQHLNLPEHAIEPALTSLIAPCLDHAPIQVEQFLSFHDRSANFPWRSQAKWIAGRLADWHDLDLETSQDIAQACFRTDHYRHALSPIGVDMPGASEKIEGALPVPTAVASTKGEMILGPDRFFDGAVFDFATAHPLNK